MEGGADAGTVRPMRRSVPATLAIGCALALLAGPAPASTATPLPGAAAPTTGPVRSEDARLAASAVRTRVSTSAANTRISTVLRTRTRSKILGAIVLLIILGLIRGRGGARGR